MTGKPLEVETATARPPSTPAAEAREQLLAGLPVTERRLRLAGVSTAVLEGGDGPPVVLLHGPGGNAAHWMRVIPELVGDAPGDRPRPARPGRLGGRWRRRSTPSACSRGSAS